jgi:O-antigen/teichoic acid export membrane protein
VSLKTIKNVAGSWFGLGTNMVVGFLLTPYILHRLGNTAFGLWVLMSAFTGYYGMLDLGLRNAIIRYVARYRATDEIDELAKVVSTGVFAYSCVAAVAAVISLVAAANVQTWFKLSAGDAEMAHTLLLVVGIGTAVGMPISLFAGVLEGLQCFALVGAVQAVGTLVRAGFIVAGLSAGHGIVFVGGVTVGVNLATAAVLMWAALAMHPRKLLRWGYVSRSTFSAMAAFGLVTFWIGIAQVFRFQLDSMVVAACISVPAVTFFAAGGRLVSYTTDVVQAMAQVFTPMSSALHASGSVDGLRRVLILGNRYSAFVAFPISAILLLIGSRFIQAWLGPQYVSSQSVLAILIVPTALYLAQATSPKILYGMARHKTLAVVLFAEGLANLILSVTLARRYGINGVAIGTAIPLFCTAAFFLPIHLCRLLHVRLRDFLLDSFGYPILLTIPVALAVGLLDMRLPSRSWRELLEIVSVAALLYGVELLVYFWFVEYPQLVSRKTEPGVAEKISYPGD